MTNINIKIQNIDPIIDTPINITIKIYYSYIKNDVMYDTNMKKIKIGMDIVDVVKSYTLNDSPIIIYQILTKIKKRGMNQVYLHDFKDKKEITEKDINLIIHKTNRGISLKINGKYAIEYNTYCNIL